MDGYVDVENELEDTVEEGESGMNGESSINIYIYIYMIRCKMDSW